MALRIANNIAAMNTQRWLSVADAGMKKSLERLSSGYRINKAADDAAGLAISQSFRANIASFKVASRNTSEAAALLQVAEGGMDQIGNMLTRLKELATQASSANVGASERTKIDSEATALTTEIDRIAGSTKYGSTALLDGNFGATQTGSLVAEATTGIEGIIDDSADNVAYRFVESDGGDTEASAKVTALGAGVAEGVWYIAQTTAGIITIANTAAIAAATITESYSGSLTGSTLAFANLGITITVTDSTLAAAVGFSAAAAATALTLNRTGLTSLTVNNADTGTYTITHVGDLVTIANSDSTATQSVTRESASAVLNFDVLNISFVLGAGYSAAELDAMQLTVSANTDSTGNTFQIGSENHADSQIAIAIGGVSTTVLGLSDLDLSSTSGAQAALTSIDSAISTLAGSRGDIGASMNRLSYASANLSTMIENVQAAESVIRDVDMANEMTDFTKNQILLQAGTAMLAQANMAPQQVLALFG